MTRAEKLQFANKLLEMGIINTPQDYMGILNMEKKMIDISPEIIKYFNENESQLSEYIVKAETYDTSYSVPSVFGQRAVQFNSMDGTRHCFSSFEFLVWKNNKDIYNSPLYKALRE